ncbi:MAG: hypothetical protein JNM74_04470 [Myxococcales bacterium]|nr:hypothetical protein [Myxococcales bacterium]
MALAAVGCGRNEAEDPPRPADLRADPGERIMVLRAASRVVEGDPDAKIVALELERLSGWLAKAETLYRADENPSLRDLLLDTAEGQLSAIRARYALERARRGEPRSGARPTSPELSALPKGSIR